MCVDSALAPCPLTLAPCLACIHTCSCILRVARDTYITCARRRVACVWALGTCLCRLCWRCPEHRYQGTASSSSSSSSSSISCRRWILQQFIRVRVAFPRLTLVHRPGARVPTERQLGLGGDCGFGIWLFMSPYRIFMRCINVAGHILFILVIRGVTMLLVVFGQRHTMLRKISAGPVPWRRLCGC